jgi:hypothetical protein
MAAEARRGPVKTLAKALILALMLSAGTWSAANVLKPSFDFDEYSYNQKDAMGEAVSREVKRLEDATQRLNEAAKPDRTEETQNKLSALLAKQAVAQNEFEILKNADTKDSWEEAKERMEEALGEYRDAYKQALDRVKDEQNLMPKEGPIE